MFLWFIGLLTSNRKTLDYYLWVNHFYERSIKPPQLIKINSLTL